MASDNATFSLRMLRLEDYQNLQSIAGIRKMSIAALAARRGNAVDRRQLRRHP